MKPIIYFIFLALLITSCSGGNHIAPRAEQTALVNTDATEKKQEKNQEQKECDIINAAYSQCTIYDLSSFVCADGKNLDFYSRMESMTLSAMLSIPYPIGAIHLPVITPNDDPGRLRDEQFFKTIYGASQSAVRKNLVEIDFLGQPAIFNGKNGAAEALRAVGADLLALSTRNADVKKYLEPWLTKKQLLYNKTTGETATFLWRKIKGTNNLSNHSFGTAIDLFDTSAQVPYYWLWDEADRRAAKLSTQSLRVTRAEVLETLLEKDVPQFVPNKIVHVPQALVDAFEKHGFIWGGKWNHFDAMHFEYRPEFFVGLKTACSFEQQGGAEASL